MTLTMNSQWSKNDRHTYLIVNVSTNNNSEITALQTYLDIQMPEGVRMRHIGKQSADGRGHSIGVDVPDLAAGEHQHIVFKVTSRLDPDLVIAPELHLHWIDPASGDLVERHQTGTPMPTEPTEADEKLTEIVTIARSENRITRRRRQGTKKDTESLNTEHEARTRRMQHKTNFQHSSPDSSVEEREIVRTRRSERSDRARGVHRHEQRRHAEGRRMGRMMRRAWRDRQLEA